MYRKKLIEEDSDEEEWDFESFQVAELFSGPIPADWKQERKRDAVVTMDSHIANGHSEVQKNTSLHKADKIICNPILQTITPVVKDKKVPSEKRPKVSQLSVGKRIGMHMSSDVKLNKTKETAETSRRIFKKSSVTIHLKKSVKTESVLMESQDKNKNLSKNSSNEKNTAKDQPEITASIVEAMEQFTDAKMNNIEKSTDDRTVSFCTNKICSSSQKSAKDQPEITASIVEATQQFTDAKNNIEKSTDDRTISSCTNKICSSSQNSLATQNNFPENSDESNICNSPKQSSSKKKPSSQSGQNSKSTKPKTALGLLRRSKSKLGDRAIARRKSFLKKGDGLMSKSKFLKQKLGTKSSSCKREEKLESVKRTVVDGATTSTKSKPSFLFMTRKKDAGNSTFVMREFTGKNSGKKALTKDSSSKTEVIKTGKRFPGESSKKGKTVGTFSRTRKQWNDTGVKSFEGMIFSSIFAFSDELRESSENIYAKLQTLYDSLEKPKSSPIFAKRSNAFSREWRQNNEDILNNGNQEIAGIFHNLRKVESNVKTIDQAITSLLKIHLKESLNNSD